MLEKKLKRIRRHQRIRKKILGTQRKPRLCIYRALGNMQAQLIDDLNEKTLLSISTQDKQIKITKAYGGNVGAAQLLGKALAQRAKAKGISEVVFDRAGFLYHGRVKALAEAARQEGLKF